MSIILAAAAMMGLQASASDEQRPVEVMVLGSYHMANPGLDVINIKTGDVMQPAAQTELQHLADTLASWKPTKILLETTPEAPDFTIAEYREQADALLADDPDERVQVGYRIARQLGHANIYAFNEAGGADGPDYFPIGRVQQWAEANGKVADLKALFDLAGQWIEAETAATGPCSIAEKLMPHNDTEFLTKVHRHIYYGHFAFGDVEDQPGAELLSYWYMRNAKMFAKVGMIAEPGDRLLIVVGSGHKYWLDHFVTEAPGYQLVDATPYLEAVKGNRC